MTVGGKIFEIPFRASWFGTPTETGGEPPLVYRALGQGGEPPPADYTTLQDFLQVYMPRGGTAGMAVHIHVFDGGGRQLRTERQPSSIARLGPQRSRRCAKRISDRARRLPYTRVTAGLLSKPNVWTDFSAQDLFFYPRDLSAVLRNWLEYYPEKILFGTDASPSFGEIGWEETGWLAAQTARQALALALTGMINDGEITRERALELARMVLRENAAKLYGFKN